MPRTAADDRRTGTAAAPDLRGRRGGRPTAADRPALSPEHHVAFPCFGGTCAVHLSGTGPLGPAPQAIETVRRQLLAWHGRFSRFLPGSELSRLNAAEATTVAVSPELLALAEATREAGRTSGGLVDGTFETALQDAGYARHLEGPGIDLDAVLAGAPPRRPAGPDPRRRWASIEVDRPAGTVTRPPGVRIDAGGLAKGLFADLLADRLAGYERFVVDCCGDLRIGGTRRVPREVRIAGPDGEIVHVLSRSAVAVATSSVARRSWTGPDGRPAHHLLDPSTGRPAFTGIVQASASAPTALEAERRAKTVLLAGPDGAADHLRHGGVLVLEDRSVRVVEPPAPRRPLTGAVRGGRLVLSGGR